MIFSIYTVTLLVPVTGRVWAGLWPVIPPMKETPSISCSFSPPHSSQRKQAATKPRRPAVVNIMLTDGYRKLELFYSTVGNLSFMFKH